MCTLIAAVHLASFLNIGKSAPSASNHWASVGSPGPTLVHMTGEGEERTVENMATAHLTLSQRCTNGMGSTGFSGRFEQRWRQNCGSHRRTARLHVYSIWKHSKTQVNWLLFKKQTINTYLNFINTNISCRMLSCKWILLQAHNKNLKNAFLITLIYQTNRLQRYLIISTKQVTQSMAYWEKKQYYSKNNNSEVHFLVLRTELIMFYCTVFPLSTQNTMHSLSVSSLLSCTQLFRLTKKIVFQIWCSLSGEDSDRYIIHCHWASSASHLQFLSDCYTLKTHNTVLPIAGNHTPSKTESNHGRFDSSAVPLWEPKILHSSVSTKLYQRQNIHTMWARTTSLSGTYLCCIHHMVRVVVFYWR
jgi:hypothetical protein